MTPVKRGLIDLIVFLSLLTSVFAVHTATVTTNYAPIYETNPVNIGLNVANDITSTSAINQVDVQNSGFSVNSITALLGWSVTNNNSITFSTTTNAISNWGNQNFGFSALANNVNQDTTYNWIITTTDVNGDSNANQIQLQVLNDNLPPVITNTTPGPYISGGNELFSAAANDAQTGIAGSNLHLSNCDLIFDNTTNTSSTVYNTFANTCSNGICSSTQDLTAWPEGDVCFFFDASDNGGNTAATANLTTIIDRTAPTVTLTSPTNNQFLTATNVNLQFDAQDNYATQLNCMVTANGNANAIVTTGVSNSYTIPVTDGQYTWNVDCTDEVNLQGSSGTQTFTIDNQAPTITLTAPNVTDRGNNVIIDAVIADTGSGVDQNSVTATITDPNNNAIPATITNGQIILPTTTATTTGTYTVQVTAADNLGQSTSQSAQFRVRKTFTLSMSLNQTNTDASVANNNISLALTGTISTDDGNIPSGTIDVIEILQNEALVINNQTGTFDTLLGIPQANGQYTIIATYTNGADTFTATAQISVGSYCGDNIVDAGEQCDGSTTDICSNYGFSQGTVTCTTTCTIDTAQCSNPPPNNGGGNGNGNTGGGKKRTFSSSGGGIILPTPAAPTVIDTANVNKDLSQLASNNQANETPAANNIVTGEQAFGIGTGFAVLIDYAKGINKTALLALVLIGATLYVLGWKRKGEDDWDRYFKRFGHH